MKGKEKLRSQNNHSRKESKARANNLEKENKKLQLRILKLKDELNYIKRLVGRQDKLSQSLSDKRENSRRESRLCQSADREPSKSKFDKIPRPKRPSNKSSQK